MLEGVGGGFTWGAVLLDFCAASHGSQEQNAVSHSSSPDRARNRRHARRLGRPPGGERVARREPRAALGEDIGRLIHEGPKEALDLTTNTQPVMLAAAIACYRAWRAEGGAEPAALAGHSLGEYSALVAAGALTLSDALPLVRFRAQAMQEAVPVGAGAMAAILGLEPAAVGEGCSRAATASGVVSGRELQRSQADRDLRCQGRRRRGLRDSQGHGRQARTTAVGVGAVPLRIDAARCRSACASVSPRCRFAAPRIPVINNIDVAAATDPATIRDALVRQALARCAGSRWCRLCAPAA